MSEILNDKTLKINILMRLNHSKTEWFYLLYYLLSDSVLSCLLRLSTSRRLVSKTSSDWQLGFGFYPAAQKTSASDTDQLATLARLFVREFVWQPSLLIVFAFSLGMRRLWLIATSAIARRTFKIGPEYTAHRGLLRLWNF